MNILILSINVLVILMVAFFFYKSMDFFPEEGIAMAIMSIMLLIYITGMMGDTRLAIVLIYAIAFLGGIQFVSNRKFIWKRDDSGVVRHAFFTPAVIIFILVFAFAVAAFTGVLLLNWDELAQWGKAANYMVDNNRLPYGGDFDGAEVLLSSTTFFLYYIAKPTSTVLRQIDESQYYVANLILWFSAVLLPLSGTGWKSAKRSILYAVLVFASMSFLFIQPYYNIYCDQACSLWAGALIAWHMFGRKSRCFPLLTLMILWNVSLFKNMVGPLFAVIAVMAIGVFNFIGKGDTFKERLNAVKSFYKVPDYLYGCAAVIVPFLPTVIWSGFVGQNALVRSGSIVNTEDKLRLTVGSALQKVFISVSNKEAFGVVSYFTFFIFSLLLGTILCRFYFKGRKRVACQWIYKLYQAGFVCYWGILIYSYMTAFGYADSITAASIERYFSDYMMLGLIPLTIPFFLDGGESVIQKGKRTKKIEQLMAVILSVTVSILIGSSFIGYATTWFLYKETVYKERVKIRDYVKNIERITGGEGKVYMICQDEYGFPVIVADYEASSQIRREGMPYYFQDADEPKDIAGLVDTKIEYLPEILETGGYEYLWIYKKDDFFENYMKENYYLDNTKNGDFYKIERIREGKYKFVLLENIKEE